MEWLHTMDRIIGGTWANMVALPFSACIRENASEKEKNKNVSMSGDK